MFEKEQNRVFTELREKENIGMRERLPKAIKRIEQLEKENKIMRKTLESISESLALTYRTLSGEPYGK